MQATKICYSWDPAEGRYLVWKLKAKSIEILKMTLLTVLPVNYFRIQLIKTKLYNTEFGSWVSQICKLTV